MMNNGAADIQVRPAVPADAGELAVLFDHYRQFYEYGADLQLAEHFISERLTRGDSRLFVALCEEAVVGFVQCYPGFASLECRPSWLLSDLFVAPGFRRWGVAQALLDATRRAADTAGCCVVELFTAKTNAGAQRLYEANNYQADRQFIHYELWL
ncbi:N-acetyltransferase family protein [Marinobacterium sp. YM272]|uniref:GNAT family N-acetyltransferase n=1 Tax=Marinobacterium sp. YM272 TaxID=3421654 RepID=UPI003D7F9E02